MKHTEKGIIEHIGETQHFDSGFKKRVIVLELSSNPDYPNPTPFEFMKDSVDMLDGLTPGEEAEVDFYVGGNNWKEKYYSNLRGVDLRCGSQVEMPAEPEPQQNSAPEPDNSPDIDDDNLPF